MTAVRPVRREELPELAALVGRTFETDAILAWTLPSDGDSAAAAEGFFAALHRASFGDGWIWVVGEDRVDGMAMWVPPDPDDRYGRVMAEIDLVVAELMGERKPRYDAFWAWIDEHRPTSPHWYLEHVTVDPARRGNGLGRALIDHGLRRADFDRASAWLVTSKPQNVALYERFGFDVQAAEDAPDGGPHLWFMAREPTRA
ncbi:MAG TPA: GNAT family N-acetyltransferase [Actinomycetota bacterium]|nr:GNAT family N-acetyltransferase [Actinomycetota bacterium]